MQKKLITVAISAAFMTGCSSMVKEKTSIPAGLKANTGHLATSDGSIVRSGSGDCMYNGSWSSDEMINSCAGIPEKLVTLPTKKPEDVVIAKPAEPTAPTVESASAEQTATTVEQDHQPSIETVILNSHALFGTDKSNLTDRGGKAMRSLVDKLGDYTKIEKIEIIGYTDNTGSKEYNLSLSKLRAETIRGFLVSRYSDADISTSGVGEAQPHKSNATAEGRQQNRRVEIRVTAKMVKTTNAA